MSINGMKSNNRCRGYAVYLLLVVMTAMPIALRAATPVNTGYFGNVAIKGYDPVAYFTQHAAVRGDEAYALKWLGAYWHFSNESHRRLFAENPIRFAPQYGGHCAVGMSSGGLTSDIDPEAWKIVDGKLYLNYSKAVNERLNSERIERANRHWRTMRSAAGQ